MPLVIVDIITKDQRARSGLVVHAFDVATTALPAAVADPGQWDDESRNGWPGVRRTRLGSAATDRDGRTVLRYRRAEPERPVNLWITVSNPDAAADRPRLAFVAQEVRVAAGETEHYRVAVATDQMRHRRRTEAARRASTANVRQVLTRVSAEPTATPRQDDTPPAEVQAHVDGLRRARTRAGWIPPRSFELRLRWRSALGAGTPGGGEVAAPAPRVGLKFDGVRRRVAETSGDLVLEVDDGTVRAVLPHLPGRLRMPDPPVGPRATAPFDRPEL